MRDCGGDAVWNSASAVISLGRKGSGNYMPCCWKSDSSVELTNKPESHQVCAKVVAVATFKSTPVWSTW